MLFYYYLHFDLSEIIAFARYCSITPACPVTSKTVQLFIQYSKCGDVTGWQFIATHFHGIKYEIEYKSEEDTRTGSTITVE